MATQEDINSHNELFIALSAALAAGLAPLFTELFDNLSRIENPTRSQIQQLFQPIQRYIQDQNSSLQQIVEDNIKLNSDALSDQLDPQTAGTIPRLNQEVTAALEAQLAEEQNSIINQAVLGAIAGGLTAAVLSELRSSVGRAIRRLELTFENAMRQYDGALTLLRSSNQGREVRYRYAGGVIAESRQFCRQMNGRVLTESEIRSIWSSQDWAGKRPGDPFVVRGGYNCRHSWIPVAENNT